MNSCSSNVNLFKIFVYLTKGLILFVFPLYCSHRLFIDRLIGIDIFGWSERIVPLTN